MESTQKEEIENMLCHMKDEKNPMVIRSMIKNNYFHKFYDRTQKIIRNFESFLEKHLNNAYSGSFQKIVQYVVVQTDKDLKGSVENKKVIKVDRCKSQTKSKEDKENCPLGISIVSVTSSKVTKNEGTRRKIFEEQHIRSSLKRVLKVRIFVI